MPSAFQIPDSSSNLLVNSSFQVAQLGTSFTAATTPANSDDTYLFDQWVLLSDGNDIVDVSQETTTIPNGVGTACKMLVATADKKFGLLQPIENKVALNAVGENVSLSFEARIGGANATLDSFRAAIISWDSTADTITSDVVSAWNAEDADPTLVANWTYENAPSNLTLTTSFQRFTIENVAIDTASTANIAVFIWANNSDPTVADEVYVSKVKLELTAKVTQYYQPTFPEDLANCQRYYWKTFAYGTAPQQALGAGAANTIVYSAHTAGVRTTTVNTAAACTFRTVPTVTFYNPVSANATWYRFSGGAGDSGAAGVLAGAEWGLNLQNLQVAGDGAGDSIGIHLTASARL